MADILILGGGFAGVVAAETLASRLGKEHRIVMISRHQDFTFYPALVRLAFGKCEVDDVFYDLRQAMLDRRIEFIQAEIAYPDPERREVVIPHGAYKGRMPYDYCVFALGRRLATEQVPGFYEHANHLLTTGAALKFREALQGFHRGHAVIGYCHDARLSVPVFETAFALDRMLRDSGDREAVKITVIGPERLGGQLGGAEVEAELAESLRTHDIEFQPDFSVTEVNEHEVITNQNQRMAYDLLMLVPPFSGPGEAMYTGLTDINGYIRVDRHMRASGGEHLYAAGDCVNFLGPKMGHMAVLQGQVAAINLTAELAGQEPTARYEHELMLVIDEGGGDSIYLHKDLWADSEARVSQGMFWSWAKHIHQTHWQRTHS